MKVVKSISLQPEENELLENLAKKLEKSQSAVIRELIKEKAKELGLIMENQNLHSPI